MAPRIQAKNIQGINIKYEYAPDISSLFPSASPKVDEYASAINDFMQATADAKPEDRTARGGGYAFKELFDAIPSINMRPDSLYSGDSGPPAERHFPMVKNADPNGYPKREWDILPSVFGWVPRCLNRIDKTIGYKVSLTYRHDFRVPLGTASYQRNDCGQYIQVNRGGMLKPYTRWPIKGIFYTTHHHPASAEDYLAGEVLSLVAQVAANYENDPDSVEGDQECFCLTLHGQYMHFSYAKIPDDYIKRHNSGKTLENLDEVKIVLSPEYNILNAEDRFHMIWGYVALYLHLHPGA